MHALTGHLKSEKRDQPTSTRCGYCLPFAATNYTYLACQYTCYYNSVHHQAAGWTAISQIPKSWGSSSHVLFLRQFSAECTQKMTRGPRLQHPPCAGRKTEHDCHQHPEEKVSGGERWGGHVWAEPPIKNNVQITALMVIHAKNVSLHYKKEPQCKTRKRK